jgi:N-acyl-D-amino-acid deacylase
VDVCFDMHTRSFGMTNLSNVLPPWAAEGSPDEIATRLQKRATREQVKIHSSIVGSLARTGGWARMMIYNCQAHQELSRKSIAEIAKEWGLDPFDTVCQILMDEKDAIHSVLVLGYVYPPEDTHFVFDDPYCLVGSDATASSPDKPLRGGLIHGAFTWAAWFYRHFVRDTKRLSVQEAVRRLTGLPAERLGLKDRGTLRVGAWADIALFEPQGFAERGTDFEPNQIAQGMTHVLVNGIFALQNGSLTGNRNGHVLRR